MNTLGGKRSWLVLGGLLVLLATAFTATKAEATFFRKRFRYVYKPYFYKPYFFYRPYYRYYYPKFYGYGYGYNPYLAAYLGYGYGGYFPFFPTRYGYGVHGYDSGYGLGFAPNIFFNPRYHLFHETPFQKPLETGRIKYWQASYKGIEKIEDVWYELLSNGAKNAIYIDDVNGRPYGYQFEDAIHDLRGKLWERYKSWREGGGAPLPPKAQKFLLWYWQKFGGAKPDFVGPGYVAHGTGGFVSTHGSSSFVSGTPIWSSTYSTFISSPQCVDCSLGTTFFVPSSSGPG